MGRRSHLKERRNYQPCPFLNSSIYIYTAVLHSFLSIAHCRAYPHPLPILILLSKGQLHTIHLIKPWSTQQSPSTYFRHRHHSSHIMSSMKKEKKKEKMFIQIKNIWYYNVYIHKLKLSIKYFNLNITVTSHAEKVNMFTRQISDTRLSLLW